MLAARVGLCAPRSMAVFLFSGVLIAPGSSQGQQGLLKWRARKSLRGPSGRGQWGRVPLLASRPEARMVSLCPLQRHVGSKVNPSPASWIPPLLHEAPFARSYPAFSGQYFFPDTIVKCLDSAPLDFSHLL